jgi:hypothetical protein
MLKECILCNIKKEEDEFVFRTDTNKYRTVCKECNKILKRKYRNNKERNRTDQKKYYLNNKEKVLTRVKNYKLKMKDDPNYKLIRSLRRRMYNFFKGNIFSKKSTIELIGCNQTDLKKHIESLFTEGMNWNNYGYYGWHIDHKIALSNAQTNEEIYKLCHYTNLQPLWCKDNLSKNKY